MKNVALALAVAGSLALLLIALRPPERGLTGAPGHGSSMSGRPGGDGAKPTDSPAVPPDSAGALAREQAADPRSGRSAGVIEASGEEDPLSAHWDELSSSERIDEGTTRFRAALDALQSGTEIDRNIAAAESLLSVLRPEMYASSEGRERHRALEDELDRVAGDLGRHAASEL